MDDLNGLMLPSTPHIYTHPSRSSSNFLPPDVELVPYDPDNIWWFVRLYTRAAGLWSIDA